MNQPDDIPEDVTENAAQRVEDEAIGRAIREFGPDARAILGRPCFACIAIVERLRARGFDIPRKAEEEQAATIRWMLTMLVQHGSAWREKGDDFLNSNAAVSR